VSNEGNTTARRPPWLERESVDAEALRLALVIAWAPTAERVGEVTLIPCDRNDRLLGRGPAQADDPYERLSFARQRPGVTNLTPPLDIARISRRQLRVRARAGALEVERIGRCTMRVNGEAASFALLRPGDTLLFDDALLLLCGERPRELPAPRWAVAPYDFPFGGADPHGIVGESPKAWELRERIAFSAGRHEHVLLLGESGTGKELAAHAVHQLSSRRDMPYVARNAATLPAGLIDAELFGHAKNYPNPGMPERDGLIGHASGGTLFLDEIGELQPELQAHLLRVLDRGGEYQRLGDATPRSADVRLVAATNRAEHHLKADVTARFTQRIAVPGLAERREDVPLIARRLLQRAAATDSRLAAALFEGGEPRLDPLLVDRLIRNRYSLHVRELETLLWCAVSGSRGFIGLTEEVERRLSLSAPVPAVPPALTTEHIVAALEQHNGNQERAWRELGLSSRDALYRLMKKHGIAARPKRS
jgi:two-component system nitrogen regulation response regulator GlnG/two-component system response regulator HydG